MGARYSAWPDALQWLWLAASGTPEPIYPPDPDDTQAHDAALLLSADWRAMVLRDGVAFLGLTSAEDKPFHRLANAYARTIYVDTLVLAFVQSHLVHEHADRLAALRTERDIEVGLRRLEEQVITLRNEIWWQNLSIRGICNELIAAYHHQHQLGPLMTQIVADHTDWHRMVQATRDRTTATTLGLLSTIGLPFGIAYTATAVIAEPSIEAFAIATVIALVLTTLLIAWFPVLSSDVDIPRPVPFRIRNNRSPREPPST